MTSRDRLLQSDWQNNHVGGCSHCVYELKFEYIIMAVSCFVVGVYLSVYV